MIEYSIGLVLGYACAKALTPRVPSLKTKNFHIHHWVWIMVLLLGFYTYDVEIDIVYGLLTGAALQGLSYSNWSIFRES